MQAGFRGSAEFAKQLDHADLIWSDNIYSGKYPDRDHDQDGQVGRTIIGAVMEAALARVDQGMTRTDLANMARALLQALEEKHLLVYLEDEAAARASLDAAEARLARLEEGGRAQEIAAAEESLLEFLEAEVAPVLAEAGELPQARDLDV